MGSAAAGTSLRKADGNKEHLPTPSLDAADFAPAADIAIAEDAAVLAPDNQAFFREKPSTFRDQRRSKVDEFGTRSERKVPSFRFVSIGLAGRPLPGMIHPSGAGVDYF